MKPKHYVVPRAVFVPTGLALGAAGLAWMISPWCLLAMPFIYLGSVCAAPNLNLADGFLAMVTIALGFALTSVHKEAGEAVVLGTWVSWFFSAVEKRIRAVPAYDDESNV